MQVLTVERVGGAPAGDEALGFVAEDGFVDTDRLRRVVEHDAGVQLE